MTEEMYIKIDNHVEAAQGREVWQFRNKTTRDALMEIWVERQQAREDVIWQLLTERSLETAIGAQLDLLGANFNSYRNGLSDDDFRAQIILDINLLYSSGQVNVLVNSLTALSGYYSTLNQVFPLALLMHIYVDDFGDITSTEAQRINDAMQKLKAAGVRLDIGIQLTQSNVFIVSSNPLGGEAGQGVATAIDGLDGGAFVKSLV